MEVATSTGLSEEECVRLVATLQCNSQGIVDLNHHRRGDMLLAPAGVFCRPFTVLSLSSSLPFTAFHCLSLPFTAFHYPYTTFHRGSAVKGRFQPLLLSELLRRLSRQRRRVPGHRPDQEGPGVHDHLHRSLPAPNRPAGQAPGIPPLRLQLHPLRRCLAVMPRQQDIRLPVQGFRVQRLREGLDRDMREVRCEIRPERDGGAGSGGITAPQLHK